MASRTFGRRDLVRQERQRARRGEQARVQDHWRPKTRADCKGGARPCAFVGCRYNLFLDITPKGGLRLPHGEDVEALAAMPDTCALDVADRGPVTLDMAAQIQGMTRERVRQIQLMAQDRMRAEAEAMVGEKRRARLEDIAKFLEED